MIGPGGPAISDSVKLKNGRHNRRCWMMGQKTCLAVPKARLARLEDELPMPTLLDSEIGMKAVFWE